MCNARLRGGDERCPNCGKWIESTSQRNDSGWQSSSQRSSAVPPPRQSRERGQGAGVAMLFIVAIVIVGGIIGLMIAFWPSGDGPQPPRYSVSVVSSDVSRITTSGGDTFRIALTMEVENKDEYQTMVGMEFRIIILRNGVQWLLAPGQNSNPFFRSVNVVAGEISFYYAPVFDIVESWHQGNVDAADLSFEISVQSVQWV